MVGDSLLPVLVLRCLLVDDGDVGSLPTLGAPGVVHHVRATVQAYRLLQHTMNYVYHFWVEKKYDKVI